MLRIFKTLRKKLISNSVKNKILTYVFYAVGEVLLITLGIIIAFWFNDKRENTVKNEKNLKLLSALIESLDRDRYHQTLKIKAIKRASSAYDSLVAHYDGYVFKNISDKEFIILENRLFDFHLGLGASIIPSNIYLGSINTGDLDLLEYNYLKDAISEYFNRSLIMNEMAIKGNDENSTVNANLLELKVKGLDYRKNKHSEKYLVTMNLQKRYLSKQIDLNNELRGYSAWLEKHIMLALHKPYVIAPHLEVETFNEVVQREIEERIYNEFGEKPESDVVVYDSILNFKEYYTYFFIPNTVYPLDYRNYVNQEIKSIIEEYLGEQNRAFKKKNGFGLYREYMPREKSPYHFEKYR